MVKRLTKTRPRDSKEFSSTSSIQYSDNGLKSSELSEVHMTVLSVCRWYSFKIRQRSFGCQPINAPPTATVVHRTV